MSVYGKSSWTRLSLDTATLEDDYKKIQDFSNWIKISALAARIQVLDEGFTYGINPVDQARLDMKFERLTPQNQHDIYGYFNDIPVGGSGFILDDEEYDLSPFFGKFEDYEIKDKVLAFWFVKRKFVELEDADSQREQLSSQMFGRPFRMLDSDAKNEVKDMLVSETYADRSQGLVVIDFNNGKIFTDMSDDKSIQYLYLFLRENFGIEISATILFFGETEKPWQYDFFKNIIKENIISDEMDELLDCYLDDTKLAELRERYSFMDVIYRKKKTFCQYSDNKYLVDLQAPSVISDEKLKTSVGAADNICSWEILRQIEDWNVLGADVQTGNEDGIKYWKTSVGICTNISHVYKNLEMTKNFISSHSSADNKKYSDYVYNLYLCLQVFEGLYLNMIKRVLGIDENETTVGIKIVEIKADDEEV